MTLCKLFLAVTLSWYFSDRNKVCAKDDLKQYAEPCLINVDMVIMLDSSGSVGKDVWPSEVEFARRLIKRFKVTPHNSHVGIIDFSEKSIVRVDLNSAAGSSAKKIDERLQILKGQYQDSTTNTDFALKDAIKMFSNIPPGRKTKKLLIVVTDGSANGRHVRGSDITSGWELIQEPIRILKNKLGVEIFAIGVGMGIDIRQLNFMGSTSSHVLVVTNFQILLSEIGTTLSRLCPSPVKPIQPVCLASNQNSAIYCESVIRLDSCRISYCQTRVYPDDWNNPFHLTQPSELQTRMPWKLGAVFERAILKISSREAGRREDNKIQGWQERLREMCYKPVDVVLLLDCSGSVGYSTWGEIVTFTERFIKLFNISGNGSHAGVIEFGEKANTHVSCARNGKDMSQIITALKKLRSAWMSPFTRTYTHVALREAVKMLKQSKRKSVPQILLMITDGKSSYGMKSLVKPVKQLQSMGVEIYSIGVGRWYDKKELKYVANSDSSRVFTMHNFKQLVKSVIKVVEYVCPGEKIAGFVDRA